MHNDVGHLLLQFTVEINYDELNYGHKTVFFLQQTTSQIPIKKKENSDSRMTPEIFVRGSLRICKRNKIRLVPICTILQIPSPLSKISILEINKKSLANTESVTHEDFGCHA